MGRAKILSALVVLSCAGGGAGAVRGGEDRTGPEIGLRRGSAWSTLSVRPPHIVGPNANMTLKGSVLSGAISGSPLHVRITDDGADGYGPSGPVALAFKSHLDAVEVTGTWNGFRVHLDFAEGSLRGTVASGTGSLGIDLRRQFDVLGAPAAPGVAAYSTCQYVLTEVARDGSLNGTSTCSGMPEPTRLEVPRLVRKYMTRPELVVVLVALLAAPPTVASESVISPS